MYIFLFFANSNFMNNNVYSNIDVNLEYVNSRFNTLINSDIKIREFIINVKSKQFKAFIIYIDGMVDKASINDFILKPLMLKSFANQYDCNDIISEAIASNILVRKVKKFSIEDYISDHLLPQNDIEKVTSFDKIATDVASGNCILFVDTINFVFDIDVKNFDKRSIAKPENESSVMGSQEAFVENLRTNTSMIRRNLCNENLIIESLTVGKTDKNSCAVCYLKNIANSDLVSEIKYRLNNLKVNYFSSMGELMELIKDDANTTLPEIIATERVDKATNLLLEGRVVVIYNGSPYVMVMPATIFDFLTTPEDCNLNYFFANFLKVIRAISYFITLLLPGLYIAITTYHSELIPTELLFSIVASRENVPFISIIEIALMELSFEIIREAGLRVPSPLGPTVGIVRCINSWAGCCGGKYSFSNTYYYNCNNWNYFLFNSKLFIKFSLTNNKICIYTTWCNIRFFRNWNRLIFILYNTMFFKIIWYFISFSLCSLKLTKFHRILF